MSQDRILNIVSDRTTWSKSFDRQPQFAESATAEKSQVRLLEAVVKFVSDCAKRALIVRKSNRRIKLIIIRIIFSTSIGGSTTDVQEITILISSNYNQHVASSISTL